MGDGEQQAHPVAQGVPESASDADAMMGDDSSVHAPLASGSGATAVGARAGTIHNIHAEEEEDDEDYNPDAPAEEEEEEAGTSSSDEDGDGEGNDEDEALASGDEEVAAQVQPKRVYKGM